MDVFAAVEGPRSRSYRSLCYLWSALACSHIADPDDSMADDRLGSANQSTVALRQEAWSKDRTGVVHALVAAAPMALRRIPCREAQEQWGNRETLGNSNWLFAWVCHIANR